VKTIILLWSTLIALTGAQSLDFPTKLKDLHAPAEAKTVSADFEFTNKSGKTVNIRRYESTCSCMSVTVKEGKLRYAPGETGVIRANFDMGNFSGEVDKSVAVYLDNDPEDKPSVILTTRVHIPVLVSVEPKTVKWDLGGKPETKSVRITMNHSKPIKVTQVTVSNEAFKRELKTITEGKEYELLLTPADVTAPALCIVRIDTDCDIAKHKLQQVFGVIRKP
jgi:Protein of unknown function (DUF1573)